MGVIGYFGFVTVAVGTAYSVKWIDPSVLSHLSRKTGLTRRKAWTITVFTFLWIFLPVLAGAGTDDGEFWVFGAAIAGVGFFMVTMAVSSLDEFRLLQRVPYHPPENVSAGSGETLVATSGTPTPVTDAEAGGGRPETPVTGAPAVHTDWIVQQRKKIGARTVWSNLATGVESVEFTLGDGAVRVTPGRHRVFGAVETRFEIDPGADVAANAAAFLTEHPELPSPASLEKPLRIIESFIPADEPVTVVGTAEQAAEPGSVRIADAPVDELFGTHTDYATDRRGSEAILVRGAIDEARERMKKRVYGLGLVGGAMVLGGQVLSFWVSSATLSALLRLPG